MKRIFKNREEIKTSSDKPKLKDSIANTPSLKDCSRECLRYREYDTRQKLESIQINTSSPNRAHDQETEKENALRCCFAPTRAVKTERPYQELMTTWSNSTLTLCWGSFGVIILQNNLICKVECTRRCMLTLALHNSMSEYKPT